MDPKSDLPIARIANPLQGMRVSGDLNIVGTCVDDDKVERVELQIDSGEWVTVEGTEFWSYYVKVGEIPDGRRKLSVRGVDSNGLVGPVHTIQFDMDRSRPGATITQPLAGSLVSGRIELKGSVSDENGVSTVEYSLDDGKTWLPIKGSYDKKRGLFPFSVSIDTKTLSSGPRIVLIRGTDGVGSVGITPTLFVVDNNKPEIRVLSPLAGEKVDRSFVVYGSVKDDVALSSFSWKMGNQSGDLALQNGDPYWTLPLSVSDPKAASVEVLLSARDRIGNLTEYRFKFPLDKEKDLPRVTLLSPLVPSTGKSFVSAGRLLLAGFARDDDGIAAIEYWLDKENPKKIETTGAFSTVIEAIVPGKHVLQVRAVDVNGLPGPVVSVAIEDAGPPPMLQIEGIVMNGGSKNEQMIPFESGMEVAPDAKAAIQLSATTQGRLEKLVYSFAGQAEQIIQVKNAGPQRFQVPIPAAGPFGALSFSAQVVESAERTARLADHLYVTNYAVVRGDPVVNFTDERISGEGVVYFRKSREGQEPAPLIGRFIGGEIQSVRLDPATSLVQVSFQENRILVSPTGLGVSGPHKIVVRSTLGHEYSSVPFIFNNDDAGPQIQLSLPASPYVNTGSFSLQGTLTDLSGIHSSQYRILTADGQEIANGIVPINGKVGETKATTASIRLAVNLQNVPQGPVFLQVVAQDTAGNSSSAMIPLYNDIRGPEVLFVAPGADMVLPVAAGFVKDAGGLAELSYAADGINFSPLDPNKPFVISLVQTGSAKLVNTGIIKARDRAGNETKVSIPIPSNLEAWNSSPHLAEAPLAAQVETGKTAAQPVPRITLLNFQGSSGNPGNLGSQGILLFSVQALPPATISYSVGSLKGTIDSATLIPASQQNSDGTTSLFGAIALDGYASKNGPLTVSLSVKDGKGKSAAATQTVQCLLEEERPVLSVSGLEEGATTGPTVRFSISAASPAGRGIQTLQVQVDKEAPQIYENPGTLFVELTNLS
ncbi:MAG: Ig-like domain-containing protein, partial [Termitinemataceae bacterium]